MDIIAQITETTDQMIASGDKFSLKNKTFTAFRQYTSDDIAQAMAFQIERLTGLAPQVSGSAVYATFPMQEHATKFNQKLDELISNMLETDLKQTFRPDWLAEHKRLKHALKSYNNVYDEASVGEDLSAFIAQRESVACYYRYDDETDTLTERLRTTSFTAIKQTLVEMIATRISGINTEQIGQYLDELIVRIAPLISKRTLVPDFRAQNILSPVNDKFAKLSKDVHKHVMDYRALNDFKQRIALDKGNLSTLIDLMASIGESVLVDMNLHKQVKHSGHDDARFKGLNLGKEVGFYGMEDHLNKDHFTQWKLYGKSIGDSLSRTISTYLLGYVVERRFMLLEDAVVQASRELDSKELVESLLSIEDTLMTATFPTQD